MGITEGPWVATKYGYERYSINADKGVEVAACHRKANARAIAALPELVEALKVLLKKAKWDIDASDRINESLFDAVENAEAALTKAGLL